MKLMKLHIENFRGIKNQTITDIPSALILIGKNNSGKSSVLTALRMFWSDYTPKEKDFYRGNNPIIVEATFEASDAYFRDLFLDEKVGFSKTPSSAPEFNEQRTGTLWEHVQFADFKERRSNAAGDGSNEGVVHEFFDIWMKCIKRRLDVRCDMITVSAICEKDCKVQHMIGTTKISGITDFLPSIAFIDDMRSFDDEESGKAKSITSNIIDKILKNKYGNTEGNLTCAGCVNDNCEEMCINGIANKKASDLNALELEKLINYTNKKSTMHIEDRLSSKFAKNYRDGFRTNIRATSNLDKSYSISTYIYDPILGSPVSLSNVGAGIRSIYVLSLLEVYQEMRGRDTVFVIEEPELYLHPELQREMARTLWEISKSSQVVFTTHSPVLLNEFRKEEIRRTEIDDDSYEILIRDTTIEQAVNEIGYSIQDILNKEYLIFVEGVDDVECIAAIIGKYYTVDLDRISIIDAKSCNNIAIYASLRFLSMTTMRENFILLRDLDTKATQAVIDRTRNQMTENISAEYCGTILERLFITKYSSIEGYLIDETILVSNGVYSSAEKMWENMHKKLRDNKQRHFEYFEKQNRGNQTRIDEFRDGYDERLTNIKENINWFKMNIKGHDLFGYVNGANISINRYIDELHVSQIDDIIAFLDRHNYFLHRKKLNY